MATLLFILFVVAVVFFRRRYLQQKERDTLQVGVYEKSLPESLELAAVPLRDRVLRFPYDKKWEFPKTRLKLGKTLGEGAFGKVVRARAEGICDGENSTIVAVKMAKDKTSDDQQRALMEELKILMCIRQHVNVMNLLGAVTRYQKGLMVIVEYCCYGNLRNYLLKHRRFFDDLKEKFDTKVKKHKESTKKHKKSKIEQTDVLDMCDSELSSSSDSDESSEEVERLPKMEENSSSLKSGDGKPPTLLHSSVSSESFEVPQPEDKKKKHRVNTDDLICYAFQCASGMEHIASMKLIHRDLAARNVLLARDHVVKICDFGLAKDLYDYPNYVKKGNTPLPAKWMAVESLADRIFSTKSDVWSFGILLWEIFSLGSVPYPGLEVDEKFYGRLRDGYRMEKPEYAPEEIYKMMTNCWQAKPEMRPNFGRLKNSLGNLMTLEVREYYIELNAPYERKNKLYLELQEIERKEPKETKGETSIEMTEFKVFNIDPDTQDPVQANDETSKEINLNDSISQSVQAEEDSSKEMNLNEKLLSPEDQTDVDNRSSSYNPSMGSSSLESIQKLPNPVTAEVHDGPYGEVSYLPRSTITQEKGQQLLTTQL